MVLKFFKKKSETALEQKFITFSEQLALAFSKIKDDISYLNSQLTQNQQNLHDFTQWIHYLHQNQQKVRDLNSNLVKNYEDIHQKHSKLHTSHEYIVKNAEINTEELQKHKILTNKQLDTIQDWLNYLSNYINNQKGRENTLKQDIKAVENAAEDSLLTSKQLISELRSENTALKENITNLSKRLENTKISVESHISGLKSEHSKHHELHKQQENIFTEHKKTFNSHEEKLNHHSKSISELRELQSNKEPVPQPTPPPQAYSPLQTTLQDIKSNFERHIVSRIRPNRKNYVLQFILNLVGEGSYSTKELEAVVVNEKQLCGRTSFYAYLKELKLRNKLNYAEVDDRSVLVKID